MINDFKILELSNAAESMADDMDGEYSENYRDVFASMIINECLMYFRECASNPKMQSTLTIQ